MRQKIIKRLIKLKEEINNVPDDIDEAELKDLTNTYNGLKDLLADYKFDKNRYVSNVAKMVKQNQATAYFREKRNQEK
jgi:hypothetical protein